MKEIHSASSGDIRLQTIFYVHFRRTVVIKCLVSKLDLPQTVLKLARVKCKQTLPYWKWLILYFGDSPFLTLNINTIRSRSLLLRNLGNPAFFNRFSSVDTLSFKTALSPFSYILSSFRWSDGLRNSQKSAQQFSFGTITNLNRCNFVFSGTRFFILACPWEDTNLYTLYTQRWFWIYWKQFSGCPGFKSVRYLEMHSERRYKY